MMYIMQVKLMLNQKCLTGIYYARTKTTWKISVGILFSGKCQ